MSIREMKWQVENTNGFKKFISENPDAYLGAGFFIIDFEKEEASQRQMDYYIPSSKKIASFDLTGNYKVSEQLVEKPLEEIGAEEAKLSVDDVIEIVKAELNKREILLGIQKIIAILQKKDLEVSWHLSCILTGTDFAKVRIRDSDASVAKFEQINLMSLMDIRKKGDNLPFDKMERGKTEDESERNMG